MSKSATLKLEQLAHLKTYNDIVINKYLANIPNQIIIMTILHRQSTTSISQVFSLYIYVILLRT